MRGGPESLGATCDGLIDAITEFWMFSRFTGSTGRALATGAAFTLAGAMITTTGSVASAEDPADKTLQSVQVEVDRDGTIRAIDGQVISTDGDVEDSETKDYAYNPAETAAGLPVRLVTSYRTDDGAGTDLSDLEGYTGKVRVDLTVENLTVHPEQLTYDVAGVQRTTPALVGAPLTVIASADLPGAKADEVVTGTKAAVPTNGVLSQTKGGDLQVQWATILAPPQLAATAHLTLVMNAKDFEPPTFDVSVQPGLVTDPSVGALIDQAFNPAASDEMKLQANTVELIGEVNSVLSQASSTITDVRRNLDSTTDTLGNQTAADLRAATASVASSLQSVGGALDSLDSQLSSALNGTRTETLTQLQQTVQMLQGMLGDTSAPIPTAGVRGSGCNVQVSAPKEAGTFYASLLQVVGQLNGFANATDQCKVTIQQSLKTQLGPAEPTDQLCTGALAESVTCSLWSSKTNFSELADQVRGQADATIAALDLSSYQELNDQLNQMTNMIYQITHERDENDTVGTVEQLEDRSPNIADAKRLMNDVAAAARRVHQSALGVRNQLAQLQQQNADMQSTVDDLAGRLCAIADPDPLTAEPTTINGEIVEDLRRSLVTTRCPDANGNTLPNLANRSLTQQLEAHQATVTDIDGAGLQHILDETDVRRLPGGDFDTNTEIGRTLAALSDAVDPDTQPGEESFAQLLAKLRVQVDFLDEVRDDMSKKLIELRADQATIEQGVRDTFDQAANDVEGTLNGSIEPEIRKVAAVSKTAQDNLGRMFTDSATGMRRAGQGVVRNGRELVNGQRNQVERNYTDSKTAIDKSVADGLKSISSSVNSSGRDMEAATSLLSADLKRVLVDLGTGQVDGGGLLGAMATSASTAGTADYQLALATGKANSYANVRGADMDGLLLRQKQAETALGLLATLKPFELDLPAGSQHQTVYTFTIGEEK